MNKALGAKLVWRIYAEVHRCWSRILQAKYLGNDNDLLFNAELLDSSCVWNFLKSYAGMISPKIKWHLRNGQKIYFWHDSWIESERLKA